MQTDSEKTDEEQMQEYRNSIMIFQDLTFAFWSSHTWVKADNLRLTDIEMLSVIFSYEQEGISVTALAAFVHKTKSFISQTCTRLEERKLIYRTRSEKNKRTFELRLTEQGKEYVTQFCSNTARYFSPLVNNFQEKYSNADVNLFFHMLDYLTKLMRDDLIRMEFNGEKLSGGNSFYSEQKGEDFKR